MIKLNISYATKERNYLSKLTYQNVTKKVQLEPIKILRRACGTGKAANRFYYSAIFVAPDDAETYGSKNKTITENIIRKNNPQFKPKDFEFVNNVAVISN